jgi:hypothetical protein
MSEFEIPTEREVRDLVTQLKEHLRGKGPLLQGAALADVISMYFAGHHPAMREETINEWIKTMRDLIPLNEEALFEHYGGKPEGWEAN